MGEEGVRPCAPGFHVRVSEGGLCFLLGHGRSPLLVLCLRASGSLRTQGPRSTALLLSAVVFPEVEKTCPGAGTCPPALRCRPRFAPREAALGGPSPLPSPSWKNLGPLQAAPAWIPTGTGLRGALIWGKKQKQKDGPSCTRLGPEGSHGPRAALHSLGLVSLFWLLH